MKTKWIQCALWLCLMAVAIPAMSGEQADMRLWFTRAAESRSEALALGNGRIGAVLFHGVEKELFHISEETLWRNGPVSVEEGCRMRPHISRVWKLLDEGRFKEANDLVEQYWFDDRPQLRVDLMANMTLTFEGQQKFAGYHRELDMRTAMARLEYTRGDARYTRESFISAVDDVMVVRLTCNKPGRISFVLALDRETDDREYTVSAKNDTLTMRGPGDPPEAGLRFELQVKTVADGGEVSIDGKTLQVTGADSVLLYLNAETNFEYGQIKDVDLTKLCGTKIAAAVRRPYSTMRADHIAEHAAWFNRAELFLGCSTPEQRRLPTNERLNRMRGSPRQERPAKRGKKKKGKSKKRTAPALWSQTVFQYDPELEVQVFQFARYLLIASSRPGTQPATLHGIWPNWTPANKWGNNAYHLNINIAENYWPAEVTGLGEMQLPVVDLLEHYLPNAGIYAREGFGCGGVVCGHNIDAWLAPSRRGATQAAAQWIGGFGWLSQHVWEHYAFSGDKIFLRERGLPILMKAAEFFLDYSRPDPATGKIYIGPSGSPENSFLTNGERSTVDYGISMDQEIAHELYRNCLKAAEVLGMQDDPLIRRMRAALPRLALPGIGKDGRLMEWRTEREEYDPYHRHFAHIYGFHPGNRFTMDSHPTESAAVMRSLRQRMGGNPEADYAPARLDWQQTWYLSIWARFRNRDLFRRTYEDTYRIFLEPSLNSWWQDRPFQYDGSGALSAGMAEALLQSHAGEIHLLPCLPEMWPEGRFTGFRARGGVTVNATWKPNLIKAELTANRNGIFKVRHGDTVQEVSLKKANPMQIRFDLSAN